MSERVERAAAWMYRGIWKALSDGFRVPEQPQLLPTPAGEFLLSFHPSRRYLSYLKLYFWLALFTIDVLLLLGWVAVWAWDSRAGMLLTAPVVVVAVAPDIVAYIAIHLRYDTTWYVMNSRSLRCRRGIWVILEHTITFENVQNVRVSRGPVQYLFGLSTIVVETAGAAEGEHQNKFAVGNKAILEGIDNPIEIRQLIMERVQQSRSAGLGDERHTNAPVSMAWRDDHLRTLEEILTEIRALGSPGVQ